MTGQEIKEISELIKMLKSNGVKVFKGHGLELEFDESAMIPVQRNRKGKFKGKDADIPPQFSEMETLLWSVPSVPEAGEVVNG